MDILNKTALVTGGLSGIGLAIGKELLRKGVKGVALIDINTTAQDDILKSIEEEFGKGKAIAIKTDVTKLEEITNAFDKTVETFGNLDIVVNGAAIINEDWELELEVNYKGAHKVFLEAFRNYLPKYKSGKDGLIINISSIGGIDPMARQMNYCASKAALLMISRCYAFQTFYDKFKVKVFTICPGYTDTPIVLGINKEDFIKFKMNNEVLQSPEELAELVVPKIETFENGDTYVVEAKNIYKVKFLSRDEAMV